MKTIIVLALLFVCTSVYSTQNFVKFAIQKIKNDMPDSCTIGHTEIPAEGTLSLKSPLMIPFISLKSYLKEFVSRRPFAPEDSLSLATKHGKFRLWASESGILCARDPKEVELELDGPWEVETLSGITSKEHSGKALCLATLVFKLLNGKTQISLR